MRLCVDDKFLVHLNASYLSSKKRVPYFRSPLKTIAKELRRVVSYQTAAETKQKTTDCDDFARDHCGRI